MEMGATPATSTLSGIINTGREDGRANIDANDPEPSLMLCDGECRIQRFQCSTILAWD
jgi:hypothetical protein